MILVDVGEFALRTALAEYGIDCDPDDLKIGDVVISERTCIEIKRGGFNSQTNRYEHDFIASIMDQRAFIQTQNMRDAYERKIIIIENYSELIEKVLHFSREGILSTMAELSARSGISFIPTENMDETIHVILKFIEYDQKDGFHTPVNLHPKPKSLYDSQIYLLTGLFNISTIKAKQLLGEFGMPSEVFKAIIKSDFIIPSRGRVKKLSGVFTKIKGFGSKFVKDNQRLLTERAEPPDTNVNI